MATRFIQGFVFVVTRLGGQFVAVSGGFGGDRNG